MQEIFHRTSVRRFLSTPIEEEKVEQLLRAAMQAPSAGNQKPCEYYVVTNKELLEQLATASPYALPVKNAPMAIVIATRKETMMPEYAEIDAAIATENIWLAADSLDLGAVMLGIAPHRERMDIVNKLLAIPATLDAFTIIPIGYPEKVLPQQNRYEAERIHFIK